MIKCHLSRLLGEKKLKISDVARDTGINRGTITRLYQETAVRVDFDVLETLCRYLHCEVGELLDLSVSVDKDKQM
jgi:putative transcriptional regulator